MGDRAMDKCACSDVGSCVPAPCGCVNPVGGEITFCTLHEEASKMLRAIKHIAIDGIVEPNVLRNIRAIITRAAK